MNKTLTLKTHKYESEGNLSWTYNPLHNVIDENIASEDGKHALKDFDVDDLNLDTDHPVEIEVQPSYDGSVNLILNDDHDVPRIVNSAFTVQEDWKYKRVVRNQQKQTNYYPKDEIDESTRLFRTTSTFLQVNLLDVEDGGELKGGNYIFYFKYGDEDFNETDWTGESGIVSIFHGFSDNISNVRGALMHEKTNKQITLELTGVDTAFSKLYVYVKRAYADLNGVSMEECYKLSKPYNIEDKNMFITITGYEQVNSISPDVFNIQYNTYDSVATSTQVQNRLFFGNVQEIVPNHTDLSNCALNIEVTCKQGGIAVGHVSTDYSVNKISESEYYNPKNIYKHLGYWPDELYRIGVVFIYNNDTLSDVYNLKGCCFKGSNESNHIPGENYEYNMYDLNEVFINGSSRYNTRGVFQMPETKVLTNGAINPIYLKMSIPPYVIKKLSKLKIKGLFFVRQPRIPISLAQAYSIGVSKCAHIPVISKMVENRNGKLVPSYYTEGILDNKTLCRKRLWSYDIKDHKSTWEADSCALICQDANLNKPLQSILDGSTFVLKPYGEYTLNNSADYRNFSMNISNESTTDNTFDVKLAYIAPQTASKVLEGKYFSSKSGSESELVTLRNLGWDEKTSGSRPVNDFTVRGNYAGYIGVLSDLEIKPNTVYTICTQSYIGTDSGKRKTQIKLRAQDNSSFTSISQRISIKDVNKNGNVETDVFGGDCFTCTTSVKMCYNFLDYNTPLNDKIVKSDLKTISKEKVSWDYNDWKVGELNISDWNAVDIGHYATYKCMSNFNLGIRCIDDQRTDERALFGDTRSFYPYSHHSFGVSFKIPESDLLNAGNSSVLGERNFFAADKVPFVKEFFDNRIVFSNIQSIDSFQNNYRVFTSLSYTDVERQYGAIVKLLPLGANLFCVFEHGCGIVPINEKALLSTTTGQSIHLYGSDVVQSQITVISPDYGSTWEESIIVTPNGIYGVDTFAKKIWRYSSEGFAVISDMLVQRFLNDNINLTEYDLDEIVACKNVKTHFNKYKGDVMFTFYNDSKEWNLCYNERIQKWTTRYSWIPVYSANIYNSFVSTDKKRSEYYSKIDALNHVEKGLVWSGDKEPSIQYISEENRYRCDNVELTIKGFEDSEREDELSVDKTYFTWTPTIKSIDFYIGDEVQQFYTDGEAVEIYDNSDEIKKCLWHSLNVSKGKIVHWKCPNYGIIGRASDTINFEGGLHDVTHIWGKCDVWFDTYIKYPINLRNGAFVVNTGDGCSADNPLYQVYIDFDYNIHMFKEYYTKEDYTVESTDPETGETEQETIKSIRPHSTKPWEVINCNSGTVSLPIIVDWTKIEQNIALRNAIDDKLRIQFYTHGRAGNYSELNWSDESLDNQILPTKWYGKQEPFEFEFIVNANAGMQKIFDNIAIISNNAEPDSIECTIIGDSYNFNKEGIYNQSTFPDNSIDKEFKNGNYSQNFHIEFRGSGDNLVFKTKISRDNTLNQYSLTTCSKLRDITNSNYGRRLGNMHYLEDKWNIALDPIYFKNKVKQEIKNEDGTERFEYKESGINTAKLRDKWMKIRIKYKGDKLAVISAIQSLYTVSFA